MRNKLVAGGVCVRVCGCGCGCGCVLGEVLVLFFCCCSLLISELNNEVVPTG